MTSPVGYRFDASYREDVKLANGAVVSLRLLREDDRDLLIRGFQRLSPESRYRRFLSAKGRLSAADVTYLTHVDGKHHVAIGAQRIDPVTHEHEGLGLARYVVIEDEPRVAEPAITVIDAWQGQGLGRVLLERLIAAARERGVERFRATILVSNAPMLALLHEIAPGSDPTIDGDEVTLDLPLTVPNEPEPIPGGATLAVLLRLLRLAAEGAFVLLSSLRRVAGGTSDDTDADTREPHTPSE